MKPLPAFSFLLTLAGAAALFPIAVSAQGPAPVAVAHPAAGADSPSSAPPEAGPLTRDQFTALVARELSAHFNLEGDLQLELLRHWEAPDRVARRWSVAILDYPVVPASSLMVRCRLLADGASVVEQPLVLRATLWRDAWVARQPLPNNATFDPALLDIRRVDYFRERDVVPATVGDRTFIFTRAVPADRLLTWRDLARRPLVRKGELVEVSVAEGQLSISMKGLAMQNGAQGEAVQIRNPESKKDFTAFVIDENRVQVRF